MNSESALLAAYASVGPDAEPGVFARAIRIQLGMSLKEVAERLGDGTHFTTISKLEKGTMLLTYDWARSLASVYGISANVLHMPYEAMNSAKRIPVYSTPYDAIHRDQCAPDSHTGFLTASDNLFGLAIMGTPDVVSDIALYIAVIDPSQTELLNRRMYLFGGPDEISGITGIYRADGLYPSILPWPRLSDPFLVVDDKSVTVHGTVLELQRLMSSRNG